MIKETTEANREIQDSPERRAAFQIAFFGSGKEETASDKEAMKNARQVASQLVEKGFSIATGGYGGVMKAASEAAADQAQALGLNPKERVKAFPFASEQSRNREVANVHKTHSKTLPERLTHLVDESSGYVILGGGFGTTVELMVALESEVTNQNYFNGQRLAKPIVIIDPELKHADLLRQLAAREGKLNLPEVLNSIYFLNYDPESAQKAEMIITSYYQQSIGQEVDPETKSAIGRNNLANYLSQSQKFDQAAGI
jgi:predicted Rossmann-fold nucleotide-binding protein